MLEHDGAVTDLQLTVDGSRLVTSSWDSTLRVWETTTGALVHVLRGHRGPVWTMQVVGDRVYSGSADGTVRVWSLRSGACLSTFRVSAKQVWCLRVVGRALFVGESDGHIACLSIVTGRGWWQQRAFPARDGVRRLEVWRDAIVALSHFGALKLLRLHASDHSWAPPSSWIRHRRRDARRLLEHRTGPIEDPTDPPRLADDRDAAAEQALLSTSFRVPVAAAADLHSALRSGGGDEGDGHRRASTRVDRFGSEEAKEERAPPSTSVARLDELPPGSVRVSEGEEEQGRRTRLASFPTLPSPSPARHSPQLADVPSTVAGDEQAPGVAAWRVGARREEVDGCETTRGSGAAEDDEADRDGSDAAGTKPGSASSAVHRGLRRRRDEQGGGVGVSSAGSDSEGGADGDGVRSHRSHDVPEDSWSGSEDEGTQGEPEPHDDDRPSQRRREDASRGSKMRGAGHSRGVPPASPILGLGSSSSRTGRGRAGGGPSGTVAGAHFLGDRTTSNSSDSSAASLLRELEGKDVDWD